MQNSNKEMSILIFMYHKITNKGDSIYSLGKNKFEKQLQLISQKGYRTVKVNEIEKVKPQEKIIIFTFDDGDKSWVTNVLPLLKKYNFKATFFVTAGLLNKKGFLSEDDLIKLKESGMEIGTHGFSHYPLNKLGDEELKFELGFSKKYIERIIKEEIKSFSFPNGVYNRKIINLGKNPVLWMGINYCQDILFVRI
jgi:peptidoglycan/xylan/chitin deacetylase (PgdA/CDA1 family)